MFLAHLHLHYRDNHTRRPTPRYLIVAQARPGEGTDTDRLAKIAELALPLSPRARHHIWLTTAEQATARLDEPAPLASPIWLRLRDTNRWLAKYRRLSEELSDDEQSAVRQGEYAAQQLANQRRYTLFPPSDSMTLRRAKRTKMTQTSSAADYKGQTAII